MEEMIETVEQLNEILDGKVKADNTNKDAQIWLKVTCFMMAYEVATTPTKQGRKEQLEYVKENNPMFYDDVKLIARSIYEFINK